LGNERRLVGIDLGLTSEHTVAVLREDMTEVCRRRCSPTRESLEKIERAALAGASPDTRLEVVMEPTGGAWKPIAVFFQRRGHTVYRVSSAKAADLRRALSRNAKSNTIDARTLARLPVVGLQKLHPLELPDQAGAALYRQVRACKRLTTLIGKYKQRIKDLVRQTLPMSPLDNALNQTDLQILAHTGADPRVLLAMGPGRLSRLVAKASRHQLGRPRAEEWLEAARLSVELYDEHPAAAFEETAEEIKIEVRMLQAAEAELKEQEVRRERAYRQVDPEQLARTLPGMGDVGGPVLVAFMGRPQRFPGGPEFRSFTGLAPKASETGQTDRKGQPMSKAGPGLLRTTLVLAADHARQQDPQLAQIYYVQMVHRGANHRKALCVVAAHLAERALAVMKRGTPYQIRDVDGRPVSKAEAKALIAAHWTVPEEVRKQRRSRKSRKGGEAPHQVRAGHVDASARGAATRRPSPRPHADSWAGADQAPAMAGPTTERQFALDTAKAN
jgi:transposase